MAIDHRRDFRAFSAPSRADLLAAALGRSKRRVDITLGLVDSALIAKCVGQLRECRANDFILTPLLKAAVYRLVVRVTLRKHVPLSARVENPQYSIKNPARRNWLAATAIVGDMLLRKMPPG
jgi:hypothetical protein